MPRLKKVNSKLISKKYNMFKEDFISNYYSIFRLKQISIAESKIVKKKKRKFKRTLDMLMCPARACFILCYFT